MKVDIYQEKFIGTLKNKIKNESNFTRTFIKIKVLLRFY